jgi:hypothetical protein
MCNRKEALVEEIQAKARNYEEVSLRLIYIASEDVIRTSPDTGIDYSQGGWDGID